MLCEVLHDHRRANWVRAGCVPSFSNGNANSNIHWHANAHTDSVAFGHTVVDACGDCKWVVDSFSSGDTVDDCYLGGVANCHCVAVGGNYFYINNDTISVTVDDCVDIYHYVAVCERYAVR